MIATIGKCAHIGLNDSLGPVVKVDRRIRWHYATTVLRLRIGARLTRYRNCKFHNFPRTISRYSVPPSAGPLLPLPRPITYSTLWLKKQVNAFV